MKFPKFVLLAVLLAGVAVVQAAPVNLGAPASNMVVIDPVLNASIVNLGSPASNVVIIDPSTGTPADVSTLGTTNAHTWLALQTMQGGILLPTPTNPTGSNFYVDSNGNLHYVSPWYDTTFCGAKASGDATRCWFSTGFGSFITEAASAQIPNLVLDRNDYFAGGSGLDFTLNNTSNEGKGINTKTTADFPSGTGTITVTANANIVAGQAIYGAGIATGTTVTTYTAGTVVLSANTTIDIPSGTVLAFINASNSTPANSHTDTQCTSNSYTTQTGTTQSVVGCAGYGVKFAASAAIIFGGNFLCHDYTGRKSSVAGGGCLGAEFDDVASGPDDNLNRILNDDVFAESAPSADGATTIGYGIRMRPSGANAQNTPNPAKMLYGFSANTMAVQPGQASGQYGSFGDAFFCDGGEANGCFDITSGVITANLSAQGNSGQANLDFALGTNVNVGQSVSGSANLPASATVSAVYQCFATQQLSGCGAKTNETLVTLSGNLTNNITNGTTLTFTGVIPDGSLFNGIFSDAFANWTNQLAGGVVKAGTLLNSGTALTLTGFAEDSTNTTGIDYGDILWKVITNTHGAVVGEIDVTPSGSGGVVIGNPTGGGKGANTVNLPSSVYINNVLISLTYAPLANPTFTGTATLPDATACTSSGCTLGANLAANTKNISGVANLTVNNSSGPGLLNLASSATVPTVLPNRAGSTTGFGGATSTSIDAIVSGADQWRTTASHFYAIVWGAAAANETGYVCYNSGSTPANELLLDTVVCLASLRKFKIDIHGIDPDEALSETMQLSPKWYKWNQKTHPTTDKAEQPGLIAEDVAKVDSRLAAYTAKGQLKGVRYDQLSAFLVASIQAQQEEIEALHGGRIPALAAPDSEIANLRTAIGFLGLGMLFMIGANCWLFWIVRQKAKSVRPRK